jgi:hypothetical protein
VHLPGLAVGAVFIPSLALALGTWTDSNRTFEILYVALWYLGVLGRTSVFDLLGASQASVETSVPLYYFAGALALIALAVLGRRRQLRHPG